MVQCILSIHEFLSFISSTVNEREMYGERGKKCLLEVCVLCGKRKKDTCGHALHSVYNYKSDKDIESIFTIFVSSDILSSVNKFWTEETRYLKFI